MVLSRMDPVPVEPEEAARKVLVHLPRSARRPEETVEPGLARRPEGKELNEAERRRESREAKAAQPRREAESRALPKKTASPLNRRAKSFPRR